MSRPDRSSQFVQWLIRRKTQVFLLALVITLVAGWQTFRTYAALRSDLEELLPTSAKSVAALDALRRRLPGLRHLAVVVETGGHNNLPAASRFLDDLATRVAKYPRAIIEEVRVGIAAERRFVETYALQLMDPEDVAHLRRALEERRDWEVARATGTDLFDGDEAPEIPLETLRRKYEGRYGPQRRFSSDRFVSEDGRYAVLLIQASSHATNYDADAHLLQRVQEDIHALGFPDRYAAKMRVGFSGDVPTRVEEMDGLVADLSLSGVVVLLLVVIVIVWFFRSARALLILGVPLLVGTFAAFAIVALPPLRIDYLNSNTAFLGSIVIGNGINSGIILLARFREERWKGEELVLAIATAVRMTWRPTLAAASAASAAYGSLVLTDFRGFNQFGWIGGVGMLTCWASAYLFGPLMIHSIGGPIRGVDTDRTRSTPAEKFGRWVLKYSRAIVILTAVLTAAGLIGIWERRADWLENDFSKLRRRDSWVVGERYWGRIADQTLGRYLTPTVIMARDDGEAALIAQRLQLAKERGAAGDLIAEVRSVTTVLPKGRARSVDEARALERIVTPRLRKSLDPEQQRLLDSALSKASLNPLEPKDIPNALAAGLRERDGRMGRTVLVFPRLSGTWDGKRMQEFTRDVRLAASVDPAHPAPVAGSLLLSSDIASAMEADGPRATAAALGVVVCVALLAFRSGRLSLGVVASLMVGVAVMLGGLAWTGQRFNFSNFVALPITFGIAADYSINVLKRYQADGGRDLSAAVASTGGAVAMCSATTIIGFGSLLMAQNRALFSFGVFAVAGELTCLATAVCALPSVLHLFSRRRQAADAASR